MEERKAILVENPRSTLKKKYEKFKEMLLNSENHVIKLSPNKEKLRELITIGEIKFSDFQAA